MARRINTAPVDPDGLEAYVACRLIALNKCPGIRPIGIAEVVLRIIGKATLTVVGADIQSVAGAVQL